MESDASKTAKTKNGGITWISKNVSIRTGIGHRDGQMERHRQKRYNNIALCVHCMGTLTSGKKSENLP